jgi:hypothetical protein
MPYSAYDSLRAYIHKQATGQAPPAPKSRVSQAPQAPSAPESGVPQAPQAPSAPTENEQSVFEGASTGFGVGSDLTGSMPSPTGPATSPFMSGDYSLSTEGGFFGIGGTSTVNTEGVGEAISAGEAAVKSPIGTYGMFDTSTTFGKALNTITSRVSPGFQAPVPASLFGGPAGMSVGVPIPGSAITGLFSGKVVSDPYGRPSAIPSGIYGKIAEMNIENQYDIAQQVALGTPGYHQAYMGGNLVGLTPGPLGGYVVSGNFQGSPQQFMDAYAAMNAVDPKTADFSSRPGEAAFGTPLSGFVSGVGGLDAAGNFVSIAGETDTVMSADALGKQAGLVNDLFGLQEAMNYVTKANVSESVADSMMSALTRGELHASAVTDKNGNVVGYETAIGGVVTDSAGNPVTSGNGNVVTTGAGLLSPQTYNNILANTGTPGVDAGIGGDQGPGDWSGNVDSGGGYMGGGADTGFAGTSPGDFSFGVDLSDDVSDDESYSPAAENNSGGGDDGSSSSSSSSPSSGSGMSPAAAGEAGAGDSAGDSGDSGCYITTATLNNTDEVDDGETLSTFRNFRDTYMMETPERKAKLKAYYENAPKVVAALDKYSGKDQAYQTMYDKYLKPAQYLINQGANDKAEQVYDNMVGYAANTVRMAMAEGGITSNPPEAIQQVAGEVAPTAESGFIEAPPEQVSEAESVADDKPVDVPEGTFVLNAPAVEFMGSADVKKMILDATKEAERQGIDITQNDPKISRENLVSLVVSKGEVLIQPELANIIGYDRLEKINNRGKQEVERRIAENGQSPEAQQAQAAAEGGEQGFAKKPDQTDEFADIYSSIQKQGGDPRLGFKDFTKTMKMFAKGRIYRPMQAEPNTPEFDAEVREKYNLFFLDEQKYPFMDEAARDAAAQTDKANMIDKSLPLARQREDGTIYYIDRDTGKEVPNPNSGEGFISAP